VTGTVVAVAASPRHTFSKLLCDEVDLHEGLGVAGDAHYGTTVQHRSRVRADPSQPNLRQVHLLHAELFDLLARHGHRVQAGDLGENVTTRGLDLLALPVGTRLGLGDAVVTITGLRNPCVQIDRFQPGLLARVCHPDGAGGLVRLAGVMGIVSRSGAVRAGDPIEVVLPPGPHRPLTRV
jgi:MOSC domain-containing protein YiiM